MSDSLDLGCYIIGSYLQYPTRNRYLQNLRLPKVNKSQYKQSLQYSCPKYFDKLPLEIM